MTNLQRCPKCWGDNLVWTRLSCGTHVQVPCPACSLPHATTPVLSSLVTAIGTQLPPPLPLVKAFDDLKVGDRFLVDFVVAGKYADGDIRVQSKDKSPVVVLYLSKGRYEAVAHSATHPQASAFDVMTDLFRPRKYPDEKPVDGTKLVLYRMNDWKKGAWHVQNATSLANGEIWRYMPPEVDDP
jgi:hypothetical protein